MDTLQLAVPVLNGARFLAQTLHSLNAQREACRWYLQDGGSSDETLAIARTYQRTHDSITSAPDRGQSSALNEAISRMGGDIIGFINADDLLTEGAAESILGFFRENPDVDLVHGEVEWIDAAGNITGRHVGRIDSLEDMLDIYRVWWRGRQWVQPEVFFRRSLWERVGPFDTRYRLAFDFDYWVRCLKAGARLARVPRVLARFRRHPSQKSRAADEAAGEIRTSVERHLADARVSAAFRRSLQRALDYDRYRLGEGSYAANKPSFAHYLARHPGALGVPAVRARIAQSIFAGATSSP